MNMNMRNVLALVAVLAAPVALAQDEYLPQQGSAPRSPAPAMAEPSSAPTPAPAAEPAPAQLAPAAPSAAPSAAPAMPMGPAPIEGCVIVAFHLLSNGEPVEMQVVDSVPQGRFDKGAMRALERWRFGPQASCQGRYWQKLEFRTNPPGPPAERSCLEPPTPDCKVGPPRSSQ
jgi:periplasmic protein TonB